MPRPYKVPLYPVLPALVLALSIPLTLAMTFGMMAMLGVDLQQISIASLILALGLLVDDPVVAGDAIKRDLDHGHKSIIAAWLGPTKLAHAILYATITNIVAYLPFLLLSGAVGQFLVTMPIVLTCSLVASRLVQGPAWASPGRSGSRARLPVEITTACRAVRTWRSPPGASTSTRRSASVEAAI